jgi:hypothetical protein
MNPSALATLIGSLLACATLSSAQAGIREGLDAYKKQDFQTAFAEFEALAKLGNPVAQYSVGLMYYRGEGASPNTLLGYGWMRLAAQGGSAEAAALLPKLRSNMIDESVEASERLLAAFAPDALNARLMPHILPNCNYESLVPPKSIKLIVPKYPTEVRHAGISGSVLFELTIGPDGTVRDSRIVRSIPPGKFEDATLSVTPLWRYEPALKNGVPVTSVATFMISFNIRDQSAREVEQWLRKLQMDAEAGDAVSQYVYGTVLVSHPLIHKPWSEALPWITKAAQSGLREAQFELGQSLLTGRGCKADLNKGIEWLQLAAQQDEPNAQVALARIALTTGENYQPETALVWLRRAAGLGHGRASKYLAAILAASPNDAVRNPAQALELLGNVEKADRWEPTTLEIRAAALAGMGDFQAALKSQGRAIERAQKLSWDMGPLEARLQAYQRAEPWHGELLVF